MSRPIIRPDLDDEPPKRVIELTARIAAKRDEMDEHASALTKDVHLLLAGKGVTGLTGAKAEPLRQRILDHRADAGARDMPAPDGRGARIGTPTRGWTFATLGELGELVAGVNAPTGAFEDTAQAALPYVSSEDFTQGDIRTTRRQIPWHVAARVKVGAVTPTRVQHFPAGTILIAILGAGKRLGDVATLAIDAFVSSTVAGLTLDGPTAPLQPWVLTYLRHHKGRLLEARSRDVAERKDYTTGMKAPARPFSLQVSALRRVTIPLPPIGDQKLVIKAVERAERDHAAETERLIEELHALERERAKFITGDR